MTAVTGAAAPAAGMAGIPEIAIKNTQLVPKEWPYSAPRNSPGAYAAAIRAATMREIGVTDSTNQGSHTSTTSLDFQTNNTNHGTVTGFIAVHRA